MALRSGGSNVVSRTVDGSCALLLAATAIYISGPHSIKPVLIQIKPASLMLYVLSTVVFTLVWNKCVALAGLYERFGHTTGWVLSRTARVSVVMTIVLASFLAIAPMAAQRTRAVAIFFAFSFFYEVLSFYIKAKASGRTETALILGTGRRAQKAWRELRVAQSNSVTFAGFVGDCDRSALAPDIRERCVAKTEDLSTYLLDNPVDVMIVATSLRSDFDLTRNAIAVAQMFDIKVLCLEDRFELGHAPAGHEHVFSALVVTDEAKQFRTVIRYAVDKAVATLAFAVAAPIFAVTLILASVATDEPVFVREQRFGYHRKRFQMLSFNPSLTRSDALAHSGFRKHLATFLRITRLDMLPRLWNVLSGDMSLFGPEPMTTHGPSPLQDPAWAQMFRDKPGMFTQTDATKSNATVLSRSASLSHR